MAIRTIKSCRGESRTFNDRSEETLFQVESYVYVGGAVCTADRRIESSAIFHEEAVKKCERLRAEEAARGGNRRYTLGPINGR